ncbi:protoporphyrinogen/coproporphyrinogen oxidase [Puerhibacterium sp. TATVAM-FAB25]|uniref:protoporphyrinogen/coproporphyrinogen oxidase n=1 Tax=Puerhibacterium sp. TATVAM-FAB25 TaxID=3093699 RepID=UPI00397D1321
MSGAAAGAGAGTAHGAAPEDVDAIVVGGGVGGLVAARALVRRGLRTVVLEAAGLPGGPVRGGAFASLPSVPLDLGVESYAARGEAVTALARELGLTVVSPAAAQAWGYAAGRTFPLPRAGILGIPSVPWAPDVRRAIGWPGALRGALDRVLPARLVDETSLATLVRSRLGRRVADRLVTPVAAGVHSAPLDRLDVAAVAPGLLEAFHREGSLSRAVAAQRRAAPPGSAVRGIDGGIHGIVEAVVGELNADAEGWAEPPDGDLAHAGVRTGQRVVGIERLPAADGGTADPHADDRGADDGAAWLVTTAAGARLRAPRLVVATPAVAGLLTPALGGAAAPTPEPGAPIALVTLLLDAPELDAAPRGTGMLVAPDATPGAGPGAGVRAKAFTHATAKWPWLAARVRAAAGAGVHVVRLSYGRIGEALVEPDVAQATHDASVLLGVDLTGRVRDHLVQRWDGSLPPPTPAYRAALGDFVAAVGTAPGLAVAGGWVAGTGLASIVGHATGAVAEL